MGKIKVDPVLAAAWILAIVSAFFVHPTKEYLSYIDFRSLGILWSLMVVIQGLKGNGVFDRVGEGLLGHVKYGWQLAAVLVFLCFFGSMFITNDVALITFVPFSILILRSCKREDLMIPVILLQTIAANLGSMLTPIGNPQNLYLYGIAEMEPAEFILLMLPYALVSAALLMCSLLLLPGKSIPVKPDAMQAKMGNRRQIAVYLVLFVLALMTVLKMIPWYVLAPAVFAVALVMDKNVLGRADYVLLLTFVGFFIFTGNMGRSPLVSGLLERLVQGRELAAAILASQCISNVPAALLLSGFTEDIRTLLLGVNLGGLGTLIASMASLISYKAYTNAYKERKGKYLAAFTGANVSFLAVLVGAYLVFT